MNSHDEYMEGSATAAYRLAVDEAVQLAETQKKQTPSVYHEKIDQLLNYYAKALSKNTNQKNAIAARLPSVLFGEKGLHFPADQIERQRLAAEDNRKKLQRIQGVLDLIRCPEKTSTFLRIDEHRISSSDPDAVSKLTAKLARQEERLKSIRAINAYYHAHGTLDGCPGLSAEEAERLNTEMSVRADGKPYDSHTMDSMSATVWATKNRISELTAWKDGVYTGWAFKGGVVKADHETRQLQIQFDEEPSRQTKAVLKRYSFRYDSGTNIWQRRLNSRAIKMADRLDCIRPLSGKLPSELQSTDLIPKCSSWGFYIRDGTSLEHFGLFVTAKARLQELRTHQTVPLTLGLESALCSADILQVSQGKNYLLDGFTRMDQMWTNPDVSDILCCVSKEIGFDFVRPHELAEDVPFQKWDNPYFPSATPGSIAAGVYELALQYGKIKPEDAGDRSAVIAKLVRLLQSGSQGVRHVRMIAVILAADADTPGAVHESVDKLMKQFDEYQRTFQKKDRPRRKTQER